MDSMLIVFYSMRDSILEIKYRFLHKEREHCNGVLVYELWITKT